MSPRKKGAPLTANGVDSCPIFALRIPRAEREWLVVAASIMYGDAHGALSKFIRMAAVSQANAIIRERDAKAAAAAASRKKTNATK